MASRILGGTPFLIPSTSSLSPSTSSSSPSPSTSSSSPPSLDPSFKEHYFLPSESSSPSPSHQKCLENITHLINRSPTVKFMLSSLEKAGCPFQPAHLICAPCNQDLKLSGGFNDQLGVVICENQTASSSTRSLEELLTHELIHAYDHCRMDVRWDNCEHHACSEVRAAALSGDCRYLNEVSRGNFAVMGQHQECARRRAVLSVKMNPSCQREGQAEEAVSKILQQCYADTMPFDRMPR